MERRIRNTDRSSKNRMFSERILWLQVIFLSAIVLFVFYLIFVQVFDGKHYRDKAKKQRRAYSFVMRGNIYDRNGIKLVTDTVYYDIFARRDDFVHTPEELAELLSPILNIPYVSLVEKLKQKRSFNIFKEKCG